MPRAAGQIYLNNDSWIVRIWCRSKVRTRAHLD
jgi:hypothetical protein